MANLLNDSWTDIEKFFGLSGQTTADISGMSQSQAKIATSTASLSNAGVLTSLFGAATSAVGSYYAAKTQQYQLKSQASSLLFQSNMDLINARQAETSAQSIQEAGKNQISQYTMREGQEEASKQVATAARGVDLTSGSAVQQRASDAILKDIDTYTINANATRAAWEQRTQATNYSNDAALARVGSQNLTASANSVSPFAAATTSLLGSASSLSSQWDWRRKLTMASLNGAS